MKKTKNILLLCALFAIMFAFCAFSAAAETDGIFTYNIRDDQATITKIAFSGQTEIVIPETLGGYEVTTLASYALLDNTYVLGDDTVEAVYIPKTVSKLTEALDYADVSKFFVDEENENFSSDEHGVLFNKDKTVLVKAPASFSEESYTVPEGVTTLSNNAFQAVLYLKELNLPSTLNTIGEQPFFYMQSLRSIAIPEGVTYLGQNALAYCKNLESISLPSSLVTLDASALTECYSLKDVIIPEGVQTIGTYAFESDTVLERIVLPSSLKSVGQAIVGNCPNLKHVYYAGSSEDWEALNVKTGSYSGSRIDAFDVAEFHYNFDASLYENIKVSFENDVLSISGQGNIPQSGSDTFQFWDEHKDSVTTLFFDGNIGEIGQNAFSSFPNLSYVVFSTNSTKLSPNAFSDCPALSTLLFFGNVELDDSSIDSSAEYIQLFIPKSSNISGNYDSSFIRVVPFDYSNNVLNLNGSIIWDSYQFLDTLTVFCLNYDPIDVIKIDDFTFLALPLYGTNKDGDYERIEGNNLIEAELRVQAGEEELISFNDLINGITEGEISSFRLISKDSDHDEIKDTPIEIHEEQEEGGFIGAIRKAIKWVVRVIDSLLNVLKKIIGKK